MLSIEGMGKFTKSVKFVIEDTEEEEFD